MRQVQRRLGIEDDQAAADRQTASLAGLALALALVVIGLFLVRALHTKVVIEDCLLSGRINCDQVVTDPGVAAP